MCLEVIIGGEILKEVALLLHDAVELVNVDLTITVTVSLVDHVLEFLIIDVLTELLSNTSKIAEGDLVGVVIVEELEHLVLDLEAEGAHGSLKLTHVDGAGSIGV